MDEDVECPPLPAKPLQLSRVADQNQSIFFSMLPPEIRQLIYGYALVEQDGKEAISEDKEYYRPDFTHYRYIDTSILLACRRTYTEAFDIPFQNVTHRLFLGSYGSGAPRSELTQDTLSPNSMFLDDFNTNEFYLRACTTPRTTRIRQVPLFGV
jgi:hypothetical protein